MLYERLQFTVQPVGESVFCPTFLAVARLMLVPSADEKQVLWRHSPRSWVLLCALTPSTVWPHGQQAGFRNFEWRLLSFLQRVQQLLQRGASFKLLALKRAVTWETAGTRLTVQWRNSTGNEREWSNCDSDIWVLDGVFKNAPLLTGRLGCCKQTFGSVKVTLILLLCAVQLFQVDSQW